MVRIVTSSAAGAVILHVPSRTTPERDPSRPCAEVPGPVRLLLEAERMVNLLALTALTYVVSQMHCDHCRAAIERGVTGLSGVRDVDVDLEAKRVTVSGEGLDDVAIRAAIDEAGFDIDG